MDIFMTGASGYIGGTIAVRLRRDGHRLRGLVRGADKAARLAAIGIEPVIGSLDDAALLTAEARRAGGVINTADSDHRGAVAALLDGLAGSNKPFLHTSGSSIVADDACGAHASDRIYDEDTPLDPVPDKQARVAIDGLVRSGAGRGVRAAVICNTLIYGNGRGLARDSAQVPTLVAEARKSGVVRHVGRGLNVWSNVHVDDVAEIYALALAKAAPGGFYFAENGEASFRDVTAAIARRLGMAGPQDWPVDNAIAKLGKGRAVYSLGSNARVRGRRSRAELGWQPRGIALIPWIEREMAAA